MANPTSIYAVPLLQASLVMLALFLGGTRYLVRREERSTVGEAGIVTAGSVFVIFAVVQSLLAIIDATSNGRVVQASLALMIMAISTTGTAVATLIGDTDETGLTLTLKHTFYTLVSVTIFLAITYFIMMNMR